MDLHLLELTPFGHENAITREELKRRYSADRDTRDEIKKLRAEYAILNMQDGRGYFRPLESEYALVKLWLGQTRSRANECAQSLNGASSWLLLQGAVLDGQLEVGECLTE